MLRLCTVVLMSLLAGMEMDLFIPSFPELQSQFGLTPFLVELTLSINFIAFCVASLWAGMLSDRYGRRTVILSNLCLFVLGSLLCVSANHYSVLLLGRLLQGIGMAAPASLAFVIIADEYPLARQPAVMSVLNGFVAGGMAFAPVIGAAITFYFGWRGNFSFLLMLGIICLISSFIILPSNSSQNTLSLSLKTYLPLLSSGKLMTLIGGSCFLSLPYYVFICMAPILYMHDLQVPLKYFGYYQGSLALAFALGSILSPFLLRRFGQKNCLFLGSGICGFCILWIGLLILFNYQDPLMLTTAMIVYSLGVIFPLNILYPYALEAVENSRGRASALNQAVRLITTSIVLQAISYVYQGSFSQIGIAICFSLLLFLFFIRNILCKKYIVFEPLS